jgi:histidinol dehydrogenase
VVDQIRHAGAIFIGHYSVEALGDYCAGPNHVLPTARSARFSSPLGVYDFQKRTSLIEISEAGAQTGKVASVWPTAKACRLTPVLRRCAEGIAAGTQKNRTRGFLMVPA